ncbi:MAG: response regulator, partial [Candidatus Omnitrophica bacterium]|nr:response regulator [Candidatus Omnitrophota bacterium]
VLLDIIMPDIDGIQVLKTIKEIDASIPVIMITAVKDIESGRECLKLGAYDYITKPFSLDYLDKVLKTKLQELGRDI